MSLIWLTFTYGAMRFAYCALRFPLNHTPPLQLLPKTHPRIRRTGARQLYDLQRCAHLLGDVSFKQGRRRTAVEVNGGDARVRREQANDVVGDDGVGLNCAV